MSAWIVYSKDGLTERCVLRSLEYGGTHMGERAVTATFDSSSEVAFEVFDYLEYRGEKFELEAVPTVKKTSDFNYGYELRFVSLKYELERCEMRDLVPNDNGVVYPTPLTFTFTGDVRYLVERIQACLDDLYGKGVWNIVIADGVKSEEKNISIAQQNCWNALALVSTTYGLNFYVKGRTITIGGEQSLVGHTFEYGKGNGLYEIERAADTGTGIVTKLRAYGASRNLDYSYPKKPEWNDSVLPVSFALSPLRLMLPSFKTDGKTDFVLADEATIAKYGIREASMVYDDIYPTITGATYNGQAIDEIKAVDEVDESKSTFTVYLHDLEFDLEEHLTTSDAQISMKTGTLQGYTFNISGIEKLSGGYKLTLGRNSLENSEESGAYVPSKNWNMAKGDKFVLLNILMPQAYIRDAENRLLARAKEYLAQYGKTNFSYNIGLHDKFLVEHPSVYGALVEGARLSVYDAELGISEDVTIQSITITENMEENILPQVKVTLNNEPSASTLDRIQGKLNEVAAETAANNFSSQSELMAQYRKKLDKPFFEKLFVAIDKNGNEIATNDVTTPVAYILAKYDFASVGGMTMYAEGGDLDIPSIYNGLPIDNETLYWEDVDGSRVLKAKGGGGIANSVAWVNVYGKPLWITDTKPTYSYSEIEGTPDLSGYASKNEIPSLDGYATENWVTGKNYVDGASLASELKKYVTIGGDETINGLKNFANGLQIGGLGITKSQDDVIYLDANLVVRGGITMYSGNTVDVGTIFDALPIDGNTIFWENGVLKANVTEGVITNITSDMVVEALGFTPYNASNPKGYISGITSEMVVSALGYTPLQNHQTIYTLTIQKNGANVGTYTPNSAKKTINIVVPTKVSELDNDEEYATTSDLDSRIDSLINGAPTAFDTLKEIADVLAGNVDSIGDIITTLGTKADKAIKISAGTGLSGGGTLEADRTLSLATSGVTAGTYKSITVDKYGRVTSGTNPTTLAGYGITDAYTKTKVDELLSLYVTLATTQTITGEKNFTGGLKVNGNPIVYDATNKYWKLEGDLLVTGGVTMFASDSAFTPSTIMDAIATDNVNLKVVDGVLTFVGSSGGGLTEVYWNDIKAKPTFASVATSGKYADLSGLPDLSAYALASDLAKYVTLADNETIKGLKNFTKGLQIDGLGITKSQDDVIYLDANLVVRGGITMFGTNSVDVPTIMDAIATDGVNLQVVDGVLTFVGSSGGGLTEVYWDDVIGRPTLLSSFIDDVGYLQKSGGQMSGNIGYNLDRDVYDVGVPAAGTFYYNTDITTSGALFNKKSFIGSCFNETSGSWWHIISVRHRNGESDGNSYGMYLMCSLTRDDSLAWNRQRGDFWDGERVILDSVNWRNYVNVNVSGTIENAYGLHNIDTRHENFSPSSYMGRVTWHLKTMSAIGFPYGGSGFGGLLNLSPWGDASVKSQLQIAYADDSNHLCFRFGNASTNTWSSWHEFLSTRGDIVHSQVCVKAIRSVEELVFSQSEYFDNHGNMHIPNADGSWSWNIYNSNGSNVMTIYTNGNILSAGGITMYSDIRKKTKLQDVELTLKQIADAPLIEHYYNSDEKRTTHVGSIAQYWAGLNDWFCKLDTEGFYTMEIQNAALASAISIARELVKYESKTDKEIRMLNDEVKRLKKEIKILKSA